MRCVVSGRSAIAVTIASLSLAAPAALADLVTVRDAVGGQNGGMYVDPTNSQTDVTLDGVDFDLTATGMLDLEADYDDGAGFVPLDTYCINPLAGISFGVQPDDPVGLDGYCPVPLRDLPELTALEADYIEILWTNAFADSAINPGAAIKAGAFQVILWEMFLDNGLSAAGLSAGLFQLNVADDFTQDVYDQAVAYIGLITGGTWNDGVDLFVLDHPTSQDLLTEVPEPATAGLLGAGLLGLLRRRR